MGYNAAELKIDASLSNHNIPKDREDEKLWDEMCTKIEQTVQSYVEKGLKLELSHWRA